MDLEKKIDALLVTLPGYKRRVKFVPIRRQDGGTRMVCHFCGLSRVVDSFDAANPPACTDCGYPMHQEYWSERGHHSLPIPRASTKEQLQRFKEWDKR
jgi:hypothetical protein